ncbi:LysR family transcriptional regulator [Streptomyces sp. NPDC017940]|uniref:LysR family transcriptional regulator n=1 Tax=Streptomyces sp. NPDC017940 TaxID=3365017 RepID=UPI00378B7FA9
MTRTTEKARLTPMDLTIRHLRGLCAIADHGSLNRAALSLGLPQPALSRQLRRVEQLMGGSLFVRGVHGARPTPLGAVVLAHAETILGQLDDLGAQLRAHQVHRRGALRVGWATSTLYEPLLRCLRALTCGAERPRIVTVASSRELYELLHIGEIDIGLDDRTATDGCAADGSVAEIACAQTPMLAALAADHHLTATPLLTMRHLAEEEWISCSGPDGCVDWLRGICSAFDFAPRIGHDIAVTGPRSAIIRDQRSVALWQAMRATGPGVALRAIADLDLRSHQYLVYRVGSPYASHAPALAQQLAREHRALLARCACLPARLEGGSPA